LNSLLINNLKKISLTDLQSINEILNISKLKGVGKKTCEKFESVGIYNCLDLLLNFPSKYLDRRKFLNFLELSKAAQTQEEILSKGEVESSYFLPSKIKGRKLFQAKINIDGNFVYLTWFNFGAYLKPLLTSGSQIKFSGKVINSRGKISVFQPSLISEKDLQNKIEFGCIVSEYIGVKNISSKIIRKLNYQILNNQNILQSIDERFGFILDEESSLSAAFKQIHFAKNFYEKNSEVFKNNKYRKRIALEELFYLNVKLLFKNRELLNNSDDNVKEKFSVKLDLNFYNKILGSLPFTLTKGQASAIEDVINGLEETLPFKKLLIGDVGVGKTLVAFLSSLLIVDQGFKSIFMIPTEVLAKQHYNSFLELFPKYKDKTVFISGSLSVLEKKQIKKNIENYDFIFGTHALLFDYKVNNVGLVVVDEQQKFGVEQRNKLLDISNIVPNYLAMTATPIPRSLALALFSELSIIEIRDSPIGRKKIKTHLVDTKNIDKLILRIKDYLNKEQQVYWVFPAIEDLNKNSLKSVKKGFEFLKSKLPGFTIACLHGQLKSKEKLTIMNEFSSGKINLLVATTIIEVGVDVPNASIIVIENAERFGMSQLHQLRGRVGRGVEQGICVLIPGADASIDAIERLKIIENSTDGFFIANKDLEIRGPGQFLGYNQSGLSNLRIANLVYDKEDYFNTKEIVDSIANEEIVKLEKLLPISSIWFPNLQS